MEHYADPYIALGKMFYDVHGMVAEARKFLTAALELAPEATEARYILGVIYQREGQLQEALDIFAAIAAADSTHIQARTQLGLVHLQQGDLLQAENQLKWATRLAPYEPVAFLGLGQALLRSGRTKEGQRLVERGRVLGEQNTRSNPTKRLCESIPISPKPTRISPRSTTDSGA